jgi:hypothetical protein
MLPGFAVLARLLAQLDKELVIGTAPLWQSIDAQINAAKDRPAEEVFEFAELTVGQGGFDIVALHGSLNDVPHLFCGLTAAALLGAPVPTDLCELILQGGPGPLSAFEEWIDTHHGSRWNERLDMFYGENPDPRTPGSNRWRTDLGDPTVHYVDDLPRPVRVSYKGCEIPLVPLTEIETADPHATRILTRMRQRSAA